jgi:hypothetical protein
MGVEEEVEVQPAIAEPDVNPAVVVVNTQVLIHDED